MASLWWRISRSAWLWRNRNDYTENTSGLRPRLIVDVSVIIRHDAQTGIQRVVRAVWSELTKHDGRAFDLVPVFASHQHGYTYAPPGFLEEGSQPHSQEPVRARSGDKFLGLDLSAQLLPKYRGQLRAWRAAGCTVHLIVYDLLPITRPEWFNPSTVSHFGRWIRVVQNDVDQALCISASVASELRAQLKASQTRAGPAIARLELGGDIAASRPSTGRSHLVSQMLERMQSHPTILMVGTIEPRKGYDAALGAFDCLWQRKADAPDLVIVGKAGWRTQALQERLRSHPETGQRLYWLKDVSDEDLCRLYEGCRGVLMASRGEGMGLPLLEAAMHGCSILARDLPVFREQLLPRVSFFDSDRPDILGQAIMDLAGSPKRPPEANARLPDWCDSVSGLLKTIGLAPLISEPTDMSLAQMRKETEITNRSCPS